MGTTIDINDQLLQRAKRHAATQKTTLRALVERALRAELADRPAESDYRLRWRPERGALLPGIDLADREALFDVMDGRR